jgi:hypothetical protein
MLFDSEIIQKENTLSLTKLAPLILFGTTALLFRPSASVTLAVTIGLWLLALIAIALGSVAALTGRRGRPVNV